jgi:Methyltransferase domain
MKRSEGSGTFPVTGSSGVSMSDQHGSRPWVNAGQAAGEYRVRHAALFDAEVRLHNERFRAAAAAGPGDRVLDIGCGSGQSTREAGRAAAAGSALGVDLSAPLLELARQLTAEEGLRNVTYQQADAQVTRFPSAAARTAPPRTTSSSACGTPRTSWPAWTPRRPRPRCGGYAPASPSTTPATACSSAPAPGSSPRAGPDVRDRDPRGARGCRGPELGRRPSRDIALVGRTRPEAEREAFCRQAFHRPVSLRGSE